MIRPLHSFALATLAAIVAFTSHAPMARAQRLDVELFRPNVDGRGIFGVEGATVHTPGDFSIGLFLHYARSQLRLGPNAGNNSASEVTSRLIATLSGAVGVTSWFEIGATLPFALVNQYQSVAAGEAQSPGMGSIYLSPKFRLLREEDHGVSLAIITALGVPSGRDNAFLAQNGVVFQPSVVLEKGVSSMRFLGQLGATIRETAPHFALQVGNALDLRLGIGWRAHDLVELGVEALGSVQIGSGNAGNALEVLIGARFLPANNVQAWIGAGPGLLSGFGSPTLRVFAGIVYAPTEKDTDGDGVSDRFDRCPKDPGPAKNNGCPEEKKKKDEPKKVVPAPAADLDGDGVSDKDDRCPMVAGPKENQGCPWPDRDGDGVADKDDKCPDEKGDASNNGCPIAKPAAPEPDRDGDGVPDAKDRCPMKAGPVENQGCPWEDRDKDGVFDKDDKCPVDAGPKENQGCPWPDTDGDGIADKEDNCPQQKGPASNKGCPETGVVVTKGEVKITEQVNFRSGKATIVRSSYRVLDQVAAVLQQFPDLKKVEVQGHTDDQGRKATNDRLSGQRAEAVKAYLVKQGVGQDRLVAKGYGSSQPLAEIRAKMSRAKKKAARAKNRRVQFIIVERTP